MKAESALKAALRTAILLQLQAAHPATLGDEAVLCGLSILGFYVSPEKLASQMQYLCDKGYVWRGPSELCFGVMRSRLTADGIDYLESRGF